MTVWTKRDAMRCLFGGAAAIAMSLSMMGWANPTAAEDDRFRGLLEPMTAEKPYRIGVTLVHLQDDFWKGIAYGIVEEAKASGVEVARVTVAGAYGNVREQFSQLETLKTLGVDVVALGAASFDGYEPMVRSLSAAGIAVAAAGIPVNSASIAFGVTQDDKDIGRALARAICEDNPNAKVVTLPGPSGAEWARLRFEGFREAARDCPGLQIVEGAVGGSLSIDYGLSQTSDLLLKHSDATHVYTPVIPLGMGAAQAARQLGRDAKVVSSAVVREAIPLIKEGRILATVSEPGILMGRVLVQYAIRRLEGKPLPNLTEGGVPYPYTLIPVSLITAENVDGYPFDLYELPPEDWSIEALQ